MDVFGILFFLGVFIAIVSLVIFIVQLILKKGAKKLSLLILSVGAILSISSLIAGVAIENPAIKEQRRIDQATNVNVATTENERQIADTTTSEHVNGSEFPSTKNEEETQPSDNAQVEHQNRNPSKESEDKELSAIQKTIEDYLFENFGGSGDEKYETSWYDNVKNFKVFKHDDGGYSISVYTEIFPDDEGKEYAKKLPAPFFGWANTNNNKFPLESVEVYGQKNSALLYAPNPIIQ